MNRLRGRRETLDDEIYVPLLRLLLIFLFFKAYPLRYYFKNQSSKRTRNFLFVKPSVL